MIAFISGTFGFCSLMTTNWNFRLWTDWNFDKQSQSLQRSAHFRAHGNRFGAFCSLLQGDFRCGKPPVLSLSDWSVIKKNVDVKKRWFIGLSSFRMEIVWAKFHVKVHNNLNVQSNLMSLTFNKIQHGKKVEVFSNICGCCAAASAASIAALTFKSISLTAKWFMSH